MRRELVAQTAPPLRDSLDNVNPWFRNREERHLSELSGAFRRLLSELLVNESARLEAARVMLLAAVGHTPGDAPLEAAEAVGELLGVDWVRETFSVDYSPDAAVAPGDSVRHRLFGTGQVESWAEGKATVRFGATVRKLAMRRRDVPLR